MGVFPYRLISSFIRVDNTNHLLRHAANVWCRLDACLGKLVVYFSNSFLPDRLKKTPKDDS